MRVFRAALVWAILVLCADTAGALNTARSLSQYGYQSYGIEAGLPQISAVAIAQTMDGYIWVGTQEGLARFDGVEFTIYDSENTEALKDDSIVALIAANEGDGLWIASYHGGLVYYNEGAFQPVPVAPSLSDTRLTCLALDLDGSLWVGTSSGLARLVDGQVTPMTGENAPGQINVMLRLPSGGLLLGAEKGLYLYEQGKFTRLSELDGAPTTPVRSLCPRSLVSGAVWIGTDAGLFGYVNGRFSEQLLGRLGRQRVDVVIEDRDGNLWVGTEHHGLHVLRGEELSSYAAGDVRGQLQIVALLEDREHNLWIGTRNDGLKLLCDSTVTRFSVDEGLPNRMALGLVDDLHGGLWVGSPAGLTRISPSGRARVFTQADGLPSDFVVSLSRDFSGALWVGTHDAGLARFIVNAKNEQEVELVRDQSWSTANGLKSDAIYGIYEDDDATIWIGTDGGLHRIKDGIISIYSEKEGLSNDKVTSILRDRNGDLWVGTDYGLDRFGSAELENHVKMAGFEGLRIMSLYLDPEDNLWIGTYGQGLRLIRRGKTSAVTRREGLFENVIYVIVPDLQDNLWMTSNKGLGKVSRRDVLNFIDGKTPKINSELHVMADCTRSREGLGSFMQPGWVTNDGRLRFSTMDGVISVHPLAEESKGQPPYLLVQAAVADRVPFEPGATLPNGVRIVEFKYTGLGFYAPRQMEFEYRLKGFEEDWTKAGHRRKALYTNLSPGKYTFEVMGTGAGGATSEQAGSLSFEVAPAVYQTVWFAILSVIGLGAALFLGLRFRTQQVKHREIQTMALAWQQVQSVLETRVDAICSLGDVLGEVIERLNRYMSDSTGAAGAVTQETAVSETALREVGESGITVHRSADKIVAKVRKSDKVAFTSHNVLIETAEAIDYMRDNAAEVSRRGVNLMEYLAEVDRTIASVKEIAEKAKVLAINASIEAVKAGRVGVGFAVVAREIKDMAQQSKSATLQTTTLLTMVRNAITEITLIGERSQQRTVVGVEMLSRSQDTVSSFSKTMSQNLKHASAIASAIEKNGSGLQLVLASFARISRADGVNRGVTQEMLIESAKLREIAQELGSLTELWKSSELNPKLFLVD